MDEFEIIERYFARRTQDESVRVGIGDDGAVLAPRAGRELVFVVDTMVEGIHYPPGMAAEDVGYRAVEVNLSDVAAMAGRPRWMTLALTLSRNDSRWLERFATGLFESASRYGVTLVGGDTTRGEQTVISVHIAGEVDPGGYLVRSGARAGDVLYVTGTPGDAAAGLALATDAKQAPRASDADRRALLRRFSRPSARVEFGAALAGRASAAIDVSDGLFGDAGKLLAASRAGGRIDLESLPLSAELLRAFGEERGRALALTGGDDYELCFTADPSHERGIRAAADRFGLPLARIGEVDGSDRLRLHRNGQPVEFRDDGYRHF